MQMLTPQEQVDIRTALKIAYQAVRDGMFILKDTNGIPFTEEKYQTIYASWQGIAEKINKNEEEIK